MELQSLRELRHPRARQRRPSQRWASPGWAGIPAFVMVASISSCDSPDQDVAGLDGTVRAMIVYQGNLIAGGDFTRASDIATSHVARWDGRRWNPVGGGMDGPVFAFAVMGNDLIAGGDFFHAGSNTAAHIARWDGSAWNALGTGTDGPVHALAAEFDLFLYAGGKFTAAGGVEAHGVARWCQGTWAPLGAGLEGTVRSLAVRNGRLVAAGDVVARQGLIDAQQIVAFEAGRWVGLNSALLTYGGTVAAARWWGEDLVIGGRFQNVWWGPKPGYSVAHKVGQGWMPVGLGVYVGDDFAAGEVDVLATDGDALMAGGTFDRCDGAVANNVARFDGGRWTPVGTGINGRVLALAAYGSAIVAAGEFTEAGGVPARHIALWDRSGWKPLGHEVDEPVP
jgi:hypothetical protein